MLTNRSWTIRPAEREDRTVLSDIYLYVRRTTFTWVDPGQFHEEDFAAHTRGERVFVCEDRAVGIAGFLALWEPEDFIHMLYIRPRFQGQGAGTALLEFLPGWPVRAYRLKCLVRNKRAMGFYASLGFQVTGNGTSPEGDYLDMQLSVAAEMSG
ncbi:GNAT family N-acetyltransferase [Rhizobium sp. BK376]|uniref:GNAT family N-acetyltransferase n=1 Tax=Rhizobium sp. BK376 TaxID=2512149 RepID=UPI0010538C67|nr:GNAT family N-acetyltransferase [Rhizobium sp. BK376]TCR90855.1 ribosomal protein S18 acetylase RimI-like enzyme [Rhizobium sp. BK376]